MPPGASNVSGRLEAKARFQRAAQLLLEGELEDVHEPLAFPAEYRPVLLRRKIQGQLAHVVGGGRPFLGAGFRGGQKLPGRLPLQGTGLAEAAGDGQVPQVLRRLLEGNVDGGKIGRASCRERGWMRGVDGG